MQSDDSEKNGRVSEEKPMLGLLKGKRKRKGPAERMWAPIKLKLDENYNYVTKNWGLRFLYYFAMFAGMPFVYLYYKMRWRFRVLGKRNMRLVRGRAAITVANHVHNVDAFMLTYPFYPNTPYFVALRHNFEAFLVGGLVRVMRGIPLPEDLKNFERFNAQVSDTLRHSTRKVHLFPEGEIAAYSRELRPFKNGAFHLAVKNGVPVLPFVFVFSAKRHIRLIVGEPVRIEDVPESQGLSEPKQVALMSKYVKDIMQGMLDGYYIPRNIDTKETAE